MKSFPFPGTFCASKFLVALAAASSVAKSGRWSPIKESMAFVVRANKLAPWQDDVQPRSLVAQRDLKRRMAVDLQVNCVSQRDLCSQSEGSQSEGRIK